jgi:hypothetical protein
MTNKIMLMIYNNILDKKLDEDFRSVGLFHDIGKVVLIMTIPADTMIYVKSTQSGKIV